MNFTLKNGVASPGDAAAGSGGAIRDRGNASLTLTSMVITKCSATADGGAIAMENTVSVPWTLTINGSKIGGNSAGDAGGGVETDGSGQVFINTTRFVHNVANRGGGLWLGGIQVGDVFQSAGLALTGTLIKDNGANSAGGGGIGNAGNGAVTIANSTFVGNTAETSGAGFSDANNQGNLTVSGSWFMLNEAGGDGGGIAEGGPITSISTSEFDENFAAGNGGGLFANCRTLTVQNSTFNVNSTDGNGGGIELRTTGTGLLGSTLTNTTIADNTASTLGSSQGGGIDAPAGFTGDLRLLNVTINGNLAAAGGGVFWAGTAGSTFSAQNTIIAKNKINGGGNFGVDAQSRSTFTDLGGNLIGISGPGSGNTGFTAATTQTGTVLNPLDPLLGPLQYNGGPMVGDPGSGTEGLKTELLLDGSPAIGKGILTGAPATDERGFPSVTNGKINVGAVSRATIV
jgi:predicted outer membrane repeat protein